jgi:putative hydrolase of the HAD superfamily
VKRALLFDLDDTLVVEEPAATASFAATAQAATARYRVDAERLALAARERARELWYATPAHPYCMRVGISSWEGLWCRFEGEEPNVQWLRKWAPRYRREVWNLALADQGVQDPMLAEELGDREKLAKADVYEYFDVVVVSAEFGIAKPDPSIFAHALSLLGSDREHTVMIGDSVARDIDGAIAAGLRSVWVNRSGQPRPADRPALVEVTTLSDLPAALGSMA